MPARSFGPTSPPRGATAIDFRRPEVRRFFIDNALLWLMEYRFDGLRLDAVHAIRDSDFLVGFARSVREAVEPGRHVHLVLENDDNDADLLRRGFDAQWSDDGHHALHVLLTGEQGGYYADYANPAEALARVLREGFAYQGEPSGVRDGASRGSRSADLPPTAFVLFLQNHDQIGNRAFGERLSILADPAALAAATLLLLLARRSRCCSWARNWAKPARSCISPTTTKTLPPWCGTGGGASLRSSPPSPIRPRAMKFRIPTIPRPSMPPSRRRSRRGRRHSNRCGISMPGCSSCAPRASRRTSPGHVRLPCRHSARRAFAPRGGSATARS